MSALPPGFRIRLARNVTVHAGGVLSGGAPHRVLIPGPAARRLLDGGELTVTDGPSGRLADKLLGSGMADPVVGSLADLPAAPPAAGDSAVTFVVPVRDRPRQLERLLESIGSGKPVIVVDDASEDPAAVQQAAGRFGAEYVPLPENLGPAGARNVGLARVTTPFTVFVDSDVVLHPAAVGRLLRHFADPQVALVGPRVLGAGSDRPGWLTRYEDSRSSLDMGARSALVHPRGTVSWLPAACLAARTAALAEGFNPGLRVAEDVDLVWTLIGRGWRVRYDAEATVRHEHRSELGPWLARKAFYGTGAHQLALRHGHNVAPAVLAPWSAALALALLAQRRWSVPVAAVLAAATALRLARRLRQAPRALPLAGVLVGQGVLAVFGQVSALLLRHWWPLTAVGCLLSRRIRRAALVAGLADAAVEYLRTRPRLDVFRFALIRRLDDVAYGAGVWFGALRGRSPQALLPELTGLRRRRR